MSVTVTSVLQSLSHVVKKNVKKESQQLFTLIYYKSLCPHISKFQDSPENLIEIFKKRNHFPRLYRSWKFYKKTVNFRTFQDLNLNVQDVQAQNHFPDFPCAGNFTKNSLTFQEMWEPCALVRQQITASMCVCVTLWTHSNILLTDNIFTKM